MSQFAASESRFWLAAGWTMFHFFAIGALLWPACVLLRWSIRRLPPQVRYATALVYCCRPLHSRGIVRDGPGVERASPANGNRRANGIALRPMTAEDHRGSAQLDAIPAPKQSRWIRESDSVTPVSHGKSFDWNTALRDGWYAHANSRVAGSRGSGCWERR